MSNYCDCHLGYDCEWCLINGQNSEFRRVIESMKEEIEYAIHSNKDDQVKRHYLKNAIRFANEVLQKEG